MEEINRIVEILFDEICDFYLSFVVFVGDRRMKAKNLKKSWIKYGEFFNILISWLYSFNSYLPVSRRGKIRGGRCRELVLKLLVV